ncbi:MAG: hypothetical protein ABSE71_00060 [Candidatus Micrarchaeaceae archaeon]|jgi:hypothetical protein|nr:DUF4175 domain-containing protein [Candidatus Micrarchaeota archaeon]HII09531.1 DUF4175 domain-containing protein [Candidatus Micrarchaeota archaeon]
MPKPRRRPHVSTFGRGSRPTGIAILTALYVIGAVFLFLIAGAFGLISSLGLSGVIGAVSGFGSAVLVIAGLVLLVTAFGLWEGHHWGWWLALVVAVLSIISIGVLDVIGFIVGVLSFWYLTRKNIKKWFRF